MGRGRNDPRAPDGNGAPLSFATQAARVLGDAAIPINTMLLGASLARGPSWQAAPPRAVAGALGVLAGALGERR